VQLFKNYLYSDGFLGVGTWYNSIVQDKDGTIWIGTTDRITAYHATRDIINANPPKIHITGLSLFNETIDWLEVEKNMDSILVLSNGVQVKDYKFEKVSNWNYIPQQLELAYDNNNLTFEFVGISTHKPHHIKYQHMLEGLEDNWSPVTSSGTAIYTNLSHGNYSFRVKAMNSEGIWSDETIYTFIINPPWWYSKWAYGIYLLLFVVGLRIVHVYQKGRVVRKEKEKAQKKELEQAREIEKA
jgi:hypothetical protein